MKEKEEKEIIDFTNFENLVDKIEKCNTLDELDTLCRIECLLYYKSKVLQRIVYKKRAEIQKIIKKI